jgi:hypothetical protein
MLEVFLDGNASVSDRLEAFRRVSAEAALEQCANRKGRVRGQRVPVRIAMHDRAEHVGRVFTFEHPTTGEHFVEHATERPHVRSSIHDLPTGLFRAHVAGGAENDADACAAQHRR